MASSISSSRVSALDDIHDQGRAPHYEALNRRKPLRRIPLRIYAAPSKLDTENTSWTHGYEGIKDQTVITIFFAYPGNPESVRETLSSAASSLNSRQDVNSITWEQLDISGKLILSQITTAINTADLVCCDVSNLNPNVLFELGYAISRRKAVWPLLDTTDEEATRTWKQFGLLSSHGYVGYANSMDIRSRILGGLGDLDPLWDDLARDVKSFAASKNLFYLPLNHGTEASRNLSRRIQRTGRSDWSVATADWDETGIAPIGWFVRRIADCGAVVVHFSAPRRTNSAIHNARSALLSGIAFGLGKKTLMVAEEGYVTPFDYQDHLKIYSSSRQLVELFDVWLSNAATDLSGLSKTASPTGTTKSHTELDALNFFEYVAEQEADSLNEYFVRTAAFEDVLTSKSVIFVGRKGVGKTANMLQAASQLRADKRNLVCVIKPSDYELQGLLDVLQRYRGRESRTYLIENMWKYLLYTEIALAAVEEAEARPAGVDPHTPMAALQAYVDSENFGLREDFSIRLEKIVESLASTESETGSLAEARDRIGAALGGGMLRDLRKKLEEAVRGYERVAVLVDNLDKAWVRHADLDDLSQLLLGLLTAVGRVATEFRHVRNKSELSVTLAVFLRSDIYHHLIRVAREPDKIRTASIAWDDNVALLRIVEERYLYAFGGQSDGRDLWTKYFPPTVRGRSVTDYICERILPRPRDLLYLVNAAVNAAVNSRHDRVTEVDLKSAERVYSRFAFEAALVPDGISVEDLEALLFELAGGPAVLNRDSIERAVVRTGIPNSVEHVIEHLLQLEFLGTCVQLEPLRYSFGAEGSDARLAASLAHKVATSTGEPIRYRVHPAFCTYLELDEGEGITN